MSRSQDTNPGSSFSEAKPVQPLHWMDNPAGLLQAEKGQCPGLSGLPMDGALPAGDVPIRIDQGPEAQLQCPTLPFSLESQHSLVGHLNELSPAVEQ